MLVELAYGRSGLQVELSDRNVKHVLSMPQLPVVPDPAREVTRRLREPVGSAPLTELAAGRSDAVIVVSDITRPVPNAALLPPLLEALAGAGMKPQDILILIATGLHRPNTGAELAEMLGPEVMASGCRIENHVARDLDAHAHVGATAQGTDAWVDRRYLEADLKRRTGLVEPHLMAGYSGGRKSICPGLCATGTILAFHRPELMESPLGVSGNLVNNPVDEEAHDVARLAGGADFILNVALNERRQITGIFAGDMLPAHNEATDHALRQCGVQIPQPVDIVISTGGGYPLDLTYYQGVKGMVAAEPIVKRGGTIIIAQENAEGIGGPECEKMLLETDDIYVAVQSCLAEDVRIIDMWQLHKLELVLRKARILNYSTGISQAIQSDLFVTPVDSVEAAVAACLTEYGPDATIAVMPEGPYLLASIQTRRAGFQPDSRD